MCFNCDEKFSRGDKCASTLFLFVTEDDEPFQDTGQPTLSPFPDDETPSDTSSAQISLHALSGHLAPETLRVNGFIGNRGVCILIDGGSTHNFLHQALVTSLGLSTTATTLRVTVGNGDELHCHQLCPAVTVIIQAQPFIVDFHVLPQCGAEVVLGVQWLKSLGPILTDYSTLTMKFIYGGKLIELSGARAQNLDHISPSQLRRLVQSDTTSSYFHIRLDPPSTSTSPNIPTTTTQQLYPVVSRM